MLKNPTKSCYSSYEQLGYPVDKCYKRPHKTMLHPLSGKLSVICPLNNRAQVVSGWMHIKNYEEKSLSMDYKFNEFTGGFGELKLREF